MAGRGWCGNNSNVQLSKEELAKLLFVHTLVHTRAMKTITLDEVAYNRLKAWKKGSKESFSSVVKRVIPEPGTLGAFLNFLETSGNSDFERDEIMEAAINERPNMKEDPWN